MTLISIREQAAVGENGQNAVLSFDGQGEYPLTIADPFSPEDEGRLEWYFEDHLRFPFTEQVRAKEAADSVIRYGEALFGQVFAAPDAHAEYKAALQTGPNTLRFEIAGSPEFHRLHWEALKDPKLPQPFSVLATMVRKNRNPQTLKATVRTSPTVNLLIVTARPRGERDVAYRTISRPLVDGLRQADLYVNVDILRPGTYQALVDHLASTEAGFYHVIHFDVHGALLTHAELQAGVESDQFLYQARYARNDIEPYEGHRAFLFFDGDGDRADPAEAGELADLLIAHQIPVAILNACQSGKQVGASETSLGSRLMQAGVQTVLAMGYSVTVSAAELMMQTLYGQLFAGKDLSAAIRRARLELYNRKGRRVYFNQTIDLEDWLLPVVYENRDLRLAVRPFTPEEQAEYLNRQASSYPFPNTVYGFFGRDVDILHIERRLLQHNLLLVRGMGGAGKTTLLHHLGAWWQTTNFVDHVFYFGYDQRAWTRQQILHTIAGKLLTPVEQATFTPLLPDAQQALLAKKLRARRHLLILDNLESITGERLAIPNTLPLDEQVALRGFLADLAGGKTLVLLGSRSGESWLAPGTFGDSVYDLPGLDSEAASQLAENILDKLVASGKLPSATAKEYRKDADFRKLLRLLDGFPLALEVVLANLSRQTPAEVLAALQAGDVTISGDSQEKTKSILQCIAYSHSNLSPEAQGLLACLAPFTSVVYVDGLESYTGHLKQQPALAHLPFERWAEVLQEAADMGLLSPHAEASSYLRLQPIFPYFLRSRMNGPEQAEVRRAVDTAFRQHYDRLGGAMAGLLKSREAQKKQLSQTLASLEYENLITALNLALSTQASIFNLYYPLSLYLRTTQDQERGLDLGKTVLAGLEQYPSEVLVGKLSLEFGGILYEIGEHQLSLKQYAAAEATYQKSLQLLTELDHVDKEKRHRIIATTYHRLGTVAFKQRQWSQAEQYNRQALQIDIDLNDRYEQAGDYHHLGMVVEEQHQWGQAEHYYEQALGIYVEFNDRYSQANIYHQLGIVAYRQRQWQQAEQYFQQALQIRIEFNDRYSQASIYLGLGAVALRQSQWEQSKQYCQEALQIYINFNDDYTQASAYGNLGAVAQEQRQWQQAREYYLRALETFAAYDDSHALGIVLGSLAWLWRDSGDATLPVAIASVLGMEAAEVETLLRGALDEAT